VRYWDSERTAHGEQIVVALSLQTELVRNLSQESSTWSSRWDKSRHVCPTFRGFHDPVGQKFMSCSAQKVRLHGRFKPVIVDICLDG
jgi:hypothetical protein